MVGLLRQRADDVGDQMFLDFSGEQFTYRQIWDRAAGYAAGLNKAGLQPDQTVVTMLDNNVDAAALWFAANLLGGIWVPVNTALKGSFLAHVVSDSDTRIVVCEADFLDRIRGEVASLPMLERILVRGLRESDRIGAVTVEPLADYLLEPDETAHVERSSRDTALIIYTGGTTGPSKGCVISNGYVFSSARGFIEQCGRAAEELNWSPLPIYHFNLVSGTILGTMMLRSSAAIAGRFSVSGFWPEMRRTGATVVNLLGSMGSLIARMDDTPALTECHGQIRVVHGAPFPAELQQIWRSRFGVQLVGGNTYGLTEAFPLTTLLAGSPSPPGSSGKANIENFDVRIFDDNDREVRVGEVGEVVCRPRRPGVMFDGYWRRPEAFVAAMNNMWFHSGDLGRFDADGFFYFADRKKDYLRRRGENISSQEVEQVILGHPAIAEVAVHAVKSEITEDDLKVTAVLKPDGRLSEGEMFEWLKDRMPYFALPRYIEFRDALPVSAVGRVHKYQLRDDGCTPTTWDREKANVTWDRR
ncbi:AMP-binding protein [Mycolicibacterium stellerae]|uniref:AMP-binding protein n=1 Tax=Mycolicibacterium stellerae TaxID=2358193 RepID=UPI0019CFD06A|nr:AMP-binding protein [Mycolicibacterium stellerae]